MDLVSSGVMFTTARMAARPSVYKYPVGRTRIETIGIILFCALMTTVAVLLLVESGTALGAGEKTDKPLQIIPLVCVAVAIGAKSTLMIYCFFLRKYPSVHVFFVSRTRFFSTTPNLYLGAKAMRTTLVADCEL